MSDEYEILWGYQHFFRVRAQVHAEGVFKLLDPELQPVVGLIGVREVDEPGLPDAFVDLKDVAIDNERFGSVIDEARKLLRQSTIIHKATSADAQDVVDRDTFLDAVGSALQAALGEELDGSSYWHVCTGVEPIEGYLVAAVLLLRANAVARVPVLEGDPVARYVVPSLLAGCVKQYLADLHLGLTRREPGNGPDFTRRPEDVLRAGADLFMYSVTTPCDEFDGLHALYYRCVEIAAMRYEGGEVANGILFAPKDHPNVDVEIQFAEPIEMQDHRAVRKALELGSADLLLASDSATIYGLARRREEYDPKRKDLFEVRFTKHHQWDLIHADTLLMRVAYGMPSVPRQPIDGEKFRTDVRRIFGGVDCDPDRLWDLVQQASQQRHGTMVVVVPDASAESMRLSHESTRIRPVDLTPAVMKQVTAIDGAVLLDPNAQCHALGVILDGAATSKGSRARGARYNSAIRYVESRQPVPVLAVVISEDGMIDLFPDLMPQIARRAVEEVLAVLRGLEATEGSVDLREFRKAVEWLYAHEFYLTKEQAEEANVLKATIDKRTPLGPNRPKIILRDVGFNPEFDESYLLDD